MRAEKALIFHIIPVVILNTIGFASPGLFHNPLYFYLSLVVLNGFLLPRIPGVWKQFVQETDLRLNLWVRKCPTCNIKLEKISGFGIDFTNETQTSYSGKKYCPKCGAIFERM